MPRSNTHNTVSSYISTAYTKNAFALLHEDAEKKEISFTGTYIQPGGAILRWKNDGPHDKYFIKYRLVGSEANVRAMLEEGKVIARGHSLGPYAEGMKGSDDKYTASLMQDGTEIDQINGYQCTIKAGEEESLHIEPTTETFDSFDAFVKHQRSKSASKAKRAPAVRATLDVLNFVMNNEKGTLITGDKPKSAKKGTRATGTIDGRLPFFQEIFNQFTSGMSHPPKFINIAGMEGNSKITSVSADAVSGTTYYAFPKSDEPEAWEGEHSLVTIVIHIAGAQKGNPNPDVLNYYKWSVSKVHPAWPVEQQHKYAQDLYTRARADATKLPVRVNGDKASKAFNSNRYMGVKGHTATKGKKAL